MASTSTNKQPLLVDRVFHNVIPTKGLASGSATLLDISGTNSSVVLLSCTTNDGAIVESIYTISRGTKVYKVNLYLSTAIDFLRPTEAVCIGQFSSANKVADVSKWTGMPNILVPTPSNAATTIQQFQGLYIPKGQNLWVSLGEASAPTADDTPIIGAQGGLY